MSDEMGREAGPDAFEAGEIGLGLDLAPAAAPAPSTPYTVLARKYRPQHFGDLIGQDAMVRTLGNAFATGRVHQAYIFTGVRGVGKTTTARILARAFNYEHEDGTGGPTIDLSVMGRHCRAIIEGRHVDVIEMDAASHTGIADIREIIESVRYRPVSARNKVYIIDEVHMLSTQAFNGLLKTLEEPPPHVKFLFATTEIRKVPITVLSRCQRFDLRRVEMGALIGHLARIASLEGVEVSQEALAVIARAAEGSVRDSLSLLDQAIAHGSGTDGRGRVDVEALRAMLGLADRARIIDLFEAVMRGEIAAALGELRAQYDVGADPATILADLGDYIHLVTRLKLTPEAASDPGMSEVERARGAALATELPLRVLNRAWQIVLKGLAEVQSAPRPVAAAEMVLVRLAYAADLPTPDEALRLLKDQGTNAPQDAAALPQPRPQGGTALARGGSAAQAQADLQPASFPSQSQPMPAVSLRPQLSAHVNPAPQFGRAEAPAPKLILRRFEDFVALAEERREIDLKIMLQRHVRLVHFEMGRFEFAAGAQADSQMANRIKRALDEWTGIRWAVALSQEQGAPTLAEQAEEKKREAESGIRADPLVRKVLEAFPGAQIVAIHQKEAQRADDSAEADAVREDRADGLPVEEADDDDEL